VLASPSGVTPGPRQAVRWLAWIVISSLILAPRIAQAQEDTTAAWKADFARLESVFQQTAGEMRRLLQMHWTIPEYHDEQRLPDGSGGFGPIVNIFASPYLGDFQYTWQIEEQGTLGILVAVVVVDTFPGSALPPPYQRLNLQPGVNCLWLSYQPRAPKDPWKGGISPAKLPGPVCRPSPPPSNLVVVRTRDPKFTNLSDYPPVARFSDATNGQPLFGTSCLEGWCEFGPSAGTWTPTPAPAAGTREERIEGWYDEQLLDERDAAGVLRPTVRATIIPQPNVNDIPERGFAGTWVQVATVHIHNPLPMTSKYFKSGLRQGRNEVYLRDSAGKWMARIVPQTGVAQVSTNVARMPHVDAAVPGTTRWRWTTADAGIWAPCGQACCRVNQ
jgi:hypothetical protein